MIDAQLVAGAVLLALLTISPGADMALVAKVAVADGRRAAFLTSLGIVSGLPVHAAASALGIAVVLATLFTVLRLLGAAYLVWLGVQAIRHAGGAAPAAPPRRARSAYLQGC